jgi:two-component sensor histidine kinase
MLTITQAGRAWIDLPDGPQKRECQSLLSADHAVPLGLLINELVANAIKYAYPDGSGAVEVSAREIDGSLHVEVSDQGKGLPEGFDIDEPRASLGSRSSAEW